MVRLKNILFLLLGLCALSTGCRKSDFFSTDDKITYRDRGTGTGTVTWKKENDILIEGLVFVNDGQILTIEPGTVVRFRAGQGENSSALVVARGGRILAQGTPEEPIIFTAEADDLEEAVPPNSRGLWGGIILLGNAPVNISAGESSIEGIPSSEPRAYFGGNNPESNSGILKYVSIRYGGTNIGDGNEINGLTLAGVGRATTVDFVEVFGNADDGVEIFGGSVNLRHLVVYGCGDDAFDYDLGWSGLGQFWLGVQTNFTGDNLVEATGGPLVGAFPYPQPRIMNATLAGNGTKGAGHFIAFSNNAGGHFANSIFINKQNGVTLENSDHPFDSYNLWTTGNLSLTHNIFYRIGATTTNSPFSLSGYYTSTELQQWQSYFQDAGNSTADPLIDISANYFVPLHKIKGTLTPYPDPWFQTVDFKGAFGESNWIDGWSRLSHLAG